MSDYFPRAKVFTALAAGLVAFGFSPIFVRFTPETPPLVLAAYRTVIAALLLLPYWIASMDRTVYKVREQMLSAFAGLCLGVHFLFWISSLYYTSVASASVLVTIHPIILILVERIWYGQKFAVSTWVGVLITFAGSVLLGISDSQIEQEFPDPLLGNVLALSAAIIFSVYILIGQKVRQRHEWVDYVFPVYFWAAVTCVLAVFVAGESPLDIGLTGIGSALGMAVFPQIIGHGSMNYAVKYVSPTLLSTLILTEPLFATFLAYMLFDELPPATSFLAMFVILGGVGLTWKRKASDE